MKNTQTVYQRVKQGLKDIAITGIALYALAGSCYINATKTGHQSADIATGRSSPTALENSVLNSFGFNPEEITIR